MCLGVASAGCATIDPLVSEGNYLTYQHAFTDAAAEAVRADAGKQCAQSKRVAVRTGGACSLKHCTTHYQCMTEADAAAHRK